MNIFQFSAGVEANFESFLSQCVNPRERKYTFVSDFAILQSHLSRMCEEVVLWSTTEFSFIDLSEKWSTGSSIMPQKKNPDIAELIRGKTGRVYGALESLLVVMKGIPLAYDKDMQEDKELSFDAIDTAKGCIRLMSGMLQTSTFQKDRMAASAAAGFSNATDAADYLVRKGVPFRDAHTIIGKLVLLAMEEGCSLDELPLEKYRSVSGAFDEDVYEAISLKECVEKRMTKGAPGDMEAALEEAGKYLTN